MGVTAAEIVNQLEDAYRASTERLRSALREFIRTGARPDPVLRADGGFAYPEIRIEYNGAEPQATSALRSFGRLSSAGLFASTVTRPALFRKYLEAQLSILMEKYGVTPTAALSRQEIPFPYVIDGSDLDAGSVTTADIARWFPTTELAHIGDEVADGTWDAQRSGHSPLALFDALRTDFSLARLQHYTGTPVEHVQRYLLFTNYQRYVEEFVRWGAGQLKAGGRYSLLSGPGGMRLTPETADPANLPDMTAARKSQMPAYHLVAENGTGISIVNIGVGPSNAKTITDHLAVLRPEAWLMIGHCGGLRDSQRIGDYVLAHAYLRDDHVLDPVLPPEIPIPPIAEVQQAFWSAAEQISGEEPEALKRRMRTGTIVTTDDRNWELRYSESALRFSQSRAVGIDMESATIAAQGYRYRVPYGTLLCVSDKPLHGELKLPGQANRFYERAVREHIDIGIAAVDALRDFGPKLHSRKLRAFDEPAFR
ncbi:AMP nucleosidase [Pacificimonas sp. WHA3]|uniref:AMP nucleosidase n=1 Tax=Pacificimonas pallii TaxID=2827236 RepID=A0ABS6SBM8_9SPHN|nr:AMP nucleosidase [Pacificimonas pallii]MBV7255498.1 AMP nucleosidase [Pacificimonas pallii]